MPPKSSPFIAITHEPPASLERGERTYVARDPIDMALARAQHAKYRTVLEDCGADVVVLDVNNHHADAVFVEDTAVVFDEVAVLTRPGAPSRRDEPRGIEPELAKYRTLRRIDAPATLDGGDVVVTGRTVLVGASSRTNREGATALADALAPFGYRVARVGLRDCLHLKSACCALPDGRLLANPAWLEAGALDAFTLVPIPADEPFGADFAAIDGTVIVSDTNPRTAALVASLGVHVRTTPLSEFEKAEGGVSCLSLIFRAP